MRRVLLIAGVLGCIGPVMAVEPTEKPGQIEFKHRYELGRTTRLRVISKSVGGIQLPGPLPEQKFQQTFEQVLSLRCRQVNADKTAVLDVTLNDIVMRMSIGAVAIDFDSRTWQPGQSSDSPVGFIGKLFSSMSGATFSVTVSEQGEPLKVEGLTEAMKKALDRLGDDQDAKMVRQFFDKLSSSLGDDTMAQQFQSFGRMSPSKKGPVKIGAKWEHTWSMKQLPFTSGAMEGKGEYELLGVEVVNGRPCAKVRVKETFSMLPLGQQPAKSAGSGSGFESLLGRMKMELSSSGGDGIAHIDYERGDVVRLRQTQTITLNMSMAADPDDSDEETRKGMPMMTQKFRTSVSVDLLDGDVGKDGAKPTAEPTAAKTEPLEAK